MLLRVTGVGCCSLLALADLCVRSTPPGGWGLLLYRVEGLFLRPFIRRVRVIIRVSVSFPYTWVPYFYSACFSFSLCVPFMDSLSLSYTCRLSYLYRVLSSIQCDPYTEGVLLLRILFLLYSVGLLFPGC